MPAAADKETRPDKPIPEDGARKGPTPNKPSPAPPDKVTRRAKPEPGAPPPPADGEEAAQAAPNLATARTAPPVGPDSPPNREDLTARPEALEPSQIEIYHYKPEFLAGKPSRNVKIYEHDDGKPEISVLGDGEIGYGQKGSEMHFGAASMLLGSTGLKVVVNHKLGYTTAVGLRFKDDATLALATDGVVEVDRSGVTAVDKSGVPYVSREVTVGSRRVIAMVKGSAASRRVADARTPYTQPQPGAADKPPAAEMKSPDSMKAEVYHWVPPLRATGVSRNIQVYEEGSGKVTYTGLVDGAELFMAKKPDGSNLPMPDALGSTNIRVKVNRQLGYTTLAGLRFKDDATVNINQDGTVEVTSAGIRAMGVQNNNPFVSQEIMVDGKPVLVMVRDKSSSGPSMAETKPPEPKNPPKTNPAPARPQIVKVSRARIALLNDGKQLTPNVPLRDVVVVLIIKGVPKELQQNLFFKAEVKVGRDSHKFNVMTIPTDDKKPIWAAVVVPLAARRLTVVLGDLPPVVVDVPLAVLNTVTEGN